MKLLWFTNNPGNAAKHLTGSLGVGGSWVLAMENMIKGQENIDLAVAFYWRIPKIEKFTSEGVTYYAIPRKKRGKIARYFKRLRVISLTDEDLELYLEVVKDFEPDLVHFFGSESPFGISIPHLEVPSVIWIQGILSTVSRQWFAGISRMDSRKFTSLKDKIKADTFNNEYKFSILNAKREKEILKNAKNIAGRTSWDRKTTSILAPDARYFTVNELMRKEFYSMEWKAHKFREQKILLTIMRDNIYKGFENIVECMRLLKPILGENIQWRVAGLSKDFMISKLVKRKFKIEYEELGIKLLGSLNGEQIANELMQTDVFVHPSHTDNSPNSVCEAMVLGLPVISTYVGGIPDLITHNEDGILVDDGDVYALTASIMELLLDSEKAVRIGKAARKRGLIRNDPNTILEDLLAMYEEILKSSHKLVHKPKLDSIYNVKK